MNEKPFGWMDGEGMQVRLAAGVKETIAHQFPDIPSDMMSDYARQWFSTYRSGLKAGQEPRGLSECLKGFAQFLSDHADTLYQTGTRNAKVGVVIRRNYGSTQVEFSYSENVTYAGEAQLRFHYDRVARIVEREHQRYSANVKAGDERTANGNGGGAEYVTIDVTKIAPELKDGRLTLKVHGGEWQKFGVPLYDEIAERCGVVKADIPLEGKEFKGWRAKVEMRGDGKPRKVVEFYDPNA